MKKVINYFLLLFFLLAVIGANVGAYQLPDLKLDLSANKINSLSKYTKDLINKTDGQVEVLVYASSNLPGELRPLFYSLRATLRSMENVNKSKFRLTIIDPTKDESSKPDLAKYGIKELQFSSINNDKFEVQKGYFGLVIKYKEKYEVLPVAGDVGNLEYLLASAIKRMTLATIDSLAIYNTSNGIQSDTQYFSKYLERSYKVTNVLLDGKNELPSEAKALIIVGLNSKLEEKGVAMVKKWVDSGKPLVVFADRVEVNQNMQATKLSDSGLEKMIEEKGIKFENGLITSQKGAIASFRSQSGNFLVQYPYWLQLPATQLDKNNPLMSGISLVLVPWATPLSITDAVKPLMWSENSSIDDDFNNITPGSLKQTDIQSGKHIVGAIRNNDVKLAVIGDRDFVTDQFVTNSQQNLALALNLVDYMVGEQGVFEIRNKSLAVSPIRELSDGLKNSIKYGNMLLPIPLLAGVYFLTLKRRQRRLI